MVRVKPSLEEIESTRTAPGPQELATETGDETVVRIDSGTAETEAGRRRGGLRLLREVVETIVLTVVIFVAINTVTGRFRIEGPSMKPNLHAGQYLIISKLEYKLHPPRRGDIVVFHHPRDASRDLIKRIIGLPGETVEIRQGEVYIDDVFLEEPFILHKSRDSGRYELGPGEFFVLGDNRPNSDDSHNWGVLHRDEIVGKAWVSYWPPSDWGGVPHFGFTDDLATEGPGTEEHSDSRARGD